MKIVRTIVWVLVLVTLVIFTINNWTPIEIKIWEGLVLETKTPALVITAFLLGLLPMWLLHRGSRWRMTRRMGALESAARNATAAAAAATGANIAPASSESDSLSSDTVPTPEAP